MDHLRLFMVSSHVVGNMDCPVEFRESSSLAGSIGRNPQVQVEPHLVVLVEKHPFGAQSFFHDPGPLEMSGSGERTATVDYTVTGKIGTCRLIQGPAHCSRGTLRSQVGRNVSVGRDLARGNLADDLIDPIEEILRLSAHPGKIPLLATL